MNIYDKTSTMDYFRIQSEMNSPILTFVRTSSKDPNTWCISLIRKKNRPKKLKMVENSSSVWTSKNWKIGRSLIFPTLVHLTCMFLASKSVIYVQILWLQKVVSNVYLQKEFTKLRRSTSCIFKKCTLYCILFKLFNTRSQIYCWLET